ncbi:hypothetical protein V1T75_09345 [Tenacibaculum sp. FZY0031]|uniref:hypothetical protein n=1 Tax=Tenacibaculum sp. FZY0031 TaxID=3116648 RepID=UPI002EBB8B7A|nr:hypothetical protein [Tenacibaculum sp. FZY0031]
METLLTNQNETLKLSSSSEVLFNVTDDQFSKIITIQTDPENPRSLNIKYNTAITCTLNTRKAFSYTIAIYTGLDSPVNKTPEETFKIEPSSLSNGNVKITSNKFNFMSGQFIIGLSVSTPANTKKTLCSFSKLISGKQGATFYESLQVLSINATNQGFEIEVQSNALPGVNPQNNRDSIFLFKNNPVDEQIKGTRVIDSSSLATTIITTDSLVEGDQYAIGYFCGNLLGACSARQFFIINNIG